MSHDTVESLTQGAAILALVVLVIGVLPEPASVVLMVGLFALCVYKLVNPYRERGE